MYHRKRVAHLSLLFPSRERTRSQYLLTFLTFAALGACNKDSEMISAPNRSRSSSVPSFAGSKFRRVDEDAMLALSQEAPSTAGYYLASDGSLVVMNVDSTKAAGSQRAASSMLARGRFGPDLQKRAHGIRIQRATYTFEQLSNWRDSAFVHVLGTVPGVEFNDLDEANNAVTLGISSEGARGQALRTMTALGVPAGALHFENVHAARPATIPGIGEEQADTLVGGYKVVWSNASGSWMCSVGLVMDYGSSRGVAVASHCTSDLYSMNNPSTLRRNGDNTAFGTEIYDPPAGGNYCPYQVVCAQQRNSDAALYSITAPGFKSRRGVIAHPTQVSTTSVDGGKNVDQTHPWFFVTADAQGPYVGMTVDKVGTTTGWTSGPVTHTCSDLMINPSHYPDPEQGRYAIRCATRANVWAGGGDSGGSVFYRHDQALTNGNVSGSDMTVSFLGMTSAIEGCCTGTDQRERGAYAWFTSQVSFHSEMYDAYGIYLNALTDASVGTPTVSATISSSHPSFSWSLVGTSGIPGSPTVQYTVFYAQIYTSADEWGNLTDTELANGTLYQNTGTSFTHLLPTVSTASNCVAYAGSTIFHYWVSASAGGLRSAVQEFCFE